MKFQRVLPGLFVAAVVAAFSVALGHLVPIVGPPVFAIVLGVVCGSLVQALRAETFTAGYKFASRPVLQVSIVVLGTGLSLGRVVEVGAESLPVMIGTLIVALAGAWVFGRWLGVRGDVQTLIGVGTAICGASAIAATTSVIKAKQADVAYAIGTIFTFNIAAVLLFPPLGHLMHMDTESFGLWAGTAINDTSSVVAAAYSYKDGAGEYAIVVKLVRTLMLIPIVIALSVLTARRATAADGSRSQLPWRRLVPLFLVGFLAASLLDTVGAIPDGWHDALTFIGSTLIAVALAGIGLALRPAEMKAAGLRPLYLGAILWVCVAVSSLGFQAVS